MTEARAHEISAAARAIAARGVHAALIAGLLWLAPQASQADDELTLVWQAPAECPQHEKVRSLIDVHVPAERRPRGAWRVEGRIALEGSRYRLELRLQGPNGAAGRSVDAEQCGGLAEVAALLVAIALDPRSEETPAPQATSTTAEAAAATAPAGAQPPSERTSGAASPNTPEALPTTSAEGASPTAAASPPLRFRVTASANVSLEAGMLSALPGIGLEPQVELRYGALRAAAALGLWISGEASVPDYPQAAVSGKALIGQLSLGIEVFEPPLALVPRAVFEHGTIFLQASGITDPTPDDAAWTAAGGGIQLSYNLSKAFEVGLCALVLAPFVRPRADITTSTGELELFASGPVSARLSLGLTYVIY